MSVLPGLDDFTGAQAALSADLNILQETGVVIAASGTVTYGPFAVNSPSYAVAIDALISASATFGLLLISMVWSDSETGLTVGAERWYFSGTTASPAISNGLTFGRGPTKANQLTVTIDNYDPAQSATVDVAIWQSSRTATRDDWRGNPNGGGYVTYTVPNTESLSCALGWVTNHALAASGVVTYQCALYAGQAAFEFVSSATGDVGIEILAPLPDRASGNWPVLLENAAIGELFTGTLVLPRCPVIVQITNSSAASTNVTFSLTALEFAS
jgi:hypothetical protein